MHDKIPARLMTLREVITAVRRSRSTIYADVRVGRFPAPIKVGCSTRWVENEIQDFIQRCISDSRAAVEPSRAAPSAAC